MTPGEHAKAAKALLAAEKGRSQIGLISLEYPEIGMDDAYAIQSKLVAAKLAEGRRIIGWKIGLTSKAMQSALNIDTPDSGVLFDDMVFEDRAVIPKNRFIQPRIEAEIAFAMKAPLEGELTPHAVRAATDYVVPAIEILDTRIVRADKATGATRTVFDTISDNAANAGIVLGKQRHAVDAFDLRWVGSIVCRNGEVEETGLGAGVLNDPVMGIVWLAGRMAAYGQRIVSGLSSPPICLAQMMA
jgi:2-oxo-hept-3-ene-1,7-dioate hydratase